ncbi:ankyrin repeat domain-containing protein [Paraburkholderia madseniana]|uniref:ankyrin repeat domain-containing protein n=1 Tax=Paraburkholderia madseniana TaxID=2599607 RepID=UPI0015C538F8|nr:ankyrin repeat domain-containing protein [Paraburkholderia madseniana]NPT69136.1 hypothetical protein [Paraburkholderia madseniana]
MKRVDSPSAPFTSAAADAAEHDQSGSTSSGAPSRRRSPLRSRAAGLFAALTPSSMRAQRHQQQPRQRPQLHGNVPASLHRPSGASTDARTAATSTSAPRPATAASSSTAPTMPEPADLAAEYGLSRPPIPGLIFAASDARLDYPAPVPGRPLTSDERNVMSNWASRIDRTLPRSAKAAFHHDVAALGHEMSGDGALLKTCIDHMREGLTECADRALLMWQQVQTARQAHHASRGAYDAGQLFLLGRGMYRLGQVDAYALTSGSGRGYGHDEGVEVVLRARETLRETLELPIPHTDGASTHDAGVVIEGLSDDALKAECSRIIRGELRDGGKALAEFLASWTPLVTHLTATTPELADLHKSINQYRDGLIESIEAHCHDPASPAAAGKAPLTSARYGARLTQGGAQVGELRDAANLAAVRGAYFPVAPGALESQWQSVTAMRTRTAARPFVQGLRDAASQGTLKAGWVHPTYRWNHLHIAAAAGDAQLTRALIDHGVPAHQADTSGLAPLHVAAASASAGSVAALIAARADANAPDRAGYRPLHWAARSGDRRTVEAMLPSVTEIDAVHPDTGTTALHLAATLGKLDVVRALLAGGANPLLKTVDGSAVRDVLKHSQAARRVPEYRLTYEALKAAERVTLAAASSHAR